MAGQIFVKGGPQRDEHTVFVFLLVRASISHLRISYLQAPRSRFRILEKQNHLVATMRTME
jgi:hypothetical protein